MQRYYAAALMVVFYSFHCLYAQDTIPSSLTVGLEEIIVTATAATPLTPVTYLDLDAEDIAPINLGQDAPYLLKWTPSVVVSSDAGTGIGYTGIWVRGSDPTRTNVTINGIPYNDSESQGVFWVNLPDFSRSADGIQIQRGVGTSVNGAGAFGATIEFSTNKLQQEPLLTVNGGLGSFGTRRGSIDYSSGVMDNGLQIDARYSKIHSDGYIDRASADLDGYYLGLSHSGRAGLLQFNAFGGHEVTYQSWNGVTDEERDAFGRTYNSVGTEKEGEPYDNEVDNYRQNHYQLHWSNDLGRNWRLRLSGHYTRGLGYFEQYKADEDLAEYGIASEDSETSDLIRRRWLDNHFYGAVYSLKYDGGRKLQLTFGGAANAYLGDHYGEVIWARFAGDSEIRDRYYDNDAEKRDYNNYVRATTELPVSIKGRPLLGYADLQLRHVRYEFLGFDDDLSRIDEIATHTFFNPKAGLLYDFRNGQAYASFAVAQREPNRNDFTENPTATRPDPEQLFNTEIGVRASDGKIDYGVNVYHMLYRDQLVLTGQLNDVGEYIRANVDRSYRLGLEVQAAYRPTSRLLLAGNLTLSRNRVAAFTDFLDDYDENFDYLGQQAVAREDTPLAFSPSFVGAAEVGYQLLPESNDHDLAITLQLKRVGERYVDNSGDPSSRLDAYSYADARLNYTFRPVVSGLFSAIHLNFLLRNITDALYDSNGWSYRYRFAGDDAALQGRYPQAGRNFLLSLALDF